MKKILYLILFFGWTVVSYSQKLVHKELNSEGKLTFAELRTDSIPRSMTQSKQLLKELLYMKTNDEFRLTDTKTDEMGNIHHYFTQYYKGVRVAYATFAVHGKGGIASHINGTFHEIDNVVTTPKLAEKDALKIAISFINAKSYSWEVPEEEEWLKEHFSKSYYPTGELVVVKDRLQGTKKFRLAWKFDISANDPISQSYIYVDALTGSVIEKESRIATLTACSQTSAKPKRSKVDETSSRANSTGTAATRYSGSRSIVTDSHSGGYYLQEVRNGTLIQTLNAQNSPTTATLFSDNNNNWTSGEYDNFNKDNAALDAHWGAEMTYEYFKTIHNRSSWNNTNGIIYGLVHFPMTTIGSRTDADAAWAGGDNKVRYGDGGPCGKPFTSLDVVAHEFAHGINNSSSRLQYYGESGALNESLSDMWAACVEYFTAPEKQCWLIGEDVTCGTALRSMSNPSSIQWTLVKADYTTITDFYPDTYNGVGYYTGTLDNGGVHENSSVSNLWFYLLVIGGSGTNDNGTCYAVNGIGFTDAAKIIYNTETIQIASSTEHSVSFSGFRSATIAAATSLFGANSPQVASVTNAWQAVGVGSGFQYTVNGLSSLCMEAQTYSIPPVPPGVTVSWSVSPTNLFGVDTGTGLTFSTGADNPSSVGTGTITATASGGCNSISIPPVTIVVGGIQNYSGLTWTTNQTITNCTVNFSNMALQGSANVQINIGSEFAATGTFECLVGTTLNVE